MINEVYYFVWLFNLFILMGAWHWQCESVQSVHDYMYIYFA